MATVGVKQPSPSAGDVSMDGQNVFDSQSDFAVDHEVWLAMDRVSIASCWSTDTRQLMKPAGMLDCQSEAMIPRQPGSPQTQYGWYMTLSSMATLVPFVLVLNDV